MSDLEPLPADLAALLSAERTAPVADVATRTALRAKLAPAVATIGKAAAATTALGAATKTLAVLALTFGAGAGAIAIAKHDAPAPTAPPIIEVRVAEAPVQPARKPALVEAPAPPTRAAVPRSARQVPAAAPEPARKAEPPRPSQAQVLKQAWAALAADDASHALALARDDEALRPSSGLVEERDALTVLALAQLGRVDEARSAAATFHSHHPDSIYRTQIERAVKETP